MEDLIKERLKNQGVALTKAAAKMQRDKMELNKLRDNYNKSKNSVETVPNYVAELGYN